jgi:AbrB family looped-hinge helix DNA binding protein
MPIFEEVRTVTANGRLVIPWVIQRALGLDHGGAVLFRVENGAVTLLPAERREAIEKPQASDAKDALVTELRTVLDAAERDRSAEASGL